MFPFFQLTDCPLILTLVFQHCISNTFSTLGQLMFEYGQCFQKTIQLTWCVRKTAAKLSRGLNPLLPTCMLDNTGITAADFNLRHSASEKAFRNVAFPFHVVFTSKAAIPAAMPPTMLLCLLRFSRISLTQPCGGKFV